MTDHADESWIASQEWRLGSWPHADSGTENLLDLSLKRYDYIWRELAKV